MSRALGVVLAGLAACACACTSPDESVEARGATGAEASPVGAECSQPYPPALTSVGGYPNPVSPQPAFTFTEIERTGPRGANSDFDGDGTDDTERLGTNSIADPVLVHHPNGDYVFADPGRGVSVLSLGDLDGDGGHEIAVLSFVLEPGGDSPGQIYVVPSSTPPGTYVPEDVGIRIHDGVYVFLPDDRTGDGVPEIAVLTATVFDAGTTEVVSSAEVMAIGAPGDARNVEPLVVYDGLISEFDYGDGNGELVVAQRSEPREPPATGLDTLLSVYAAGESTPFATFISSDADANQPTQALLSDQGRLLRNEQFTRSGYTGVYWNIDDPCTPLPAKTVSATAPAAQPVAEDPRLTG